MLRPCALGRIDEHLVGVLVLLDLAAFDLADQLRCHVTLPFLTTGAAAGLGRASGCSPDR